MPKELRDGDTGRSSRDGCKTRGTWGCGGKETKARWIDDTGKLGALDEDTWQLQFFN